MRSDMWDQIQISGSPWTWTFMSVCVKPQKHPTVFFFFLSLPHPSKTVIFPKKKKKQSLLMSPYTHNAPSTLTVSKRSSYFWLHLLVSMSDQKMEEEKIPPDYPWYCSWRSLFSSFNNISHASLCRCHPGDLSRSWNWRGLTKTNLKSISRTTQNSPSFARALLPCRRGLLGEWHCSLIIVASFSEV